MSRELIIRRAAKLETAEAHDWYDERKPGLGIEFLTAVEAVLAVIERAPDRFPVVFGPARKARLRRFPYAIYFIQRGDLISVIAVFHAKRNPQILLDRLATEES